MRIGKYRLAGLFERCRYLGLQRPGQKEQQQCGGESWDHGDGLFVLQNNRGHAKTLALKGIGEIAVSLRSPSA
jgi:hypothetical protein